MPSPAELFDQANKLLANGRAADALPLYEQVRQYAPNHPDTIANMGVAHAELGRHEEAITHYDAALRLKPDYAAAHFNRGNSLRNLGRLTDAIAAYELAVRHDVKMAAAHLNRGLVLVRLGRVGEATTSYLAALQQRPDFPEALNSLGLALQFLGRLEPALDYFDAAIRAEPDWPSAHSNRAQALLLKGEFRRGWAEYEWRWKLPRCQQRERALRRWDGSPLTGRSILLRAEQGAGDTLQFVRYAANLKEAGAGRVTLEATQRLHALLQSCEGIDGFITPDNEIENCDVQIPLLSVPGLLGTDFRSIPNRVPYLSAEATRIKRWQARLPKSGIRVGIAWQGAPGYPEDHLRSIPLTAFEPLAKIPGVRLVNLQLGPGREQIAGLAERVPLTDFGDELDADAAFLDTAAIMMSLDLVVTADTSIAHLAGALGREVWVALPVGPDWRWLRDRDDSPWYPSVRLFRQEQFGNWGDVFGRIAGVIRKRVTTEDTE